MARRFLVRLICLSFIEAVTRRRNDQPVPCYIVRSTERNNKMLKRLCVLGLLVGAFLMISSSAFAATNAGGWTRLGGDPVVPGGVNSRNDVVRLVTSSKGGTAMMYAGLSFGEQAAVVSAARRGEFRSCSLRYGSSFQKMSFGINGTSVDTNVTFLDPRYRTSPAAAWCMNVRVGNKILKILIPRKCGNFAVISRTSAPKTTPKTGPAPKPKKKTTTQKHGPTAVKCDAGYDVQIVNGMFYCVAQTNNNTTTQTASGTTSGQGSPVVNLVVNQTTQVNVNQQQNQGQTQVVSPPAPCTCGTPPPAPAPKPAPTVTITSIIDLNDVPEGKSSGPMPFTVNASASGSVTVDPGNGGISGCSSSTPQASITLDLQPGNNSLCVIYYAPGEASANSGSITYTAIVGTAKDVKIDNFAITHPVRP